ncbi:MAG: hypothetical protein OK454_00205 [Thaumarchaeota archaeon]|nr:hypothetical protein [Nitrososphaerota archaeon]
MRPRYSFSTTRPSPEGKLAFEVGVKVAKTQAIWDRIVSEIQGFVMKDEGFTEVERDTPTIFVCYPFLHKDRPKLLDNKKVKLL